MNSGPSNAAPKPEDLRALANWRMPFGKHKGSYIMDLPEPYLVWFSQEGFPDGRLGSILETALVVKTNGLERLVTPFRKEDN
jgi:uncharacterized protein (DUF3820 family)